MEHVLDLAIVGGGPCGVACGIAAQQAGLRYAIFEKRYLASSVAHFPVNMRFFSSAELLELGGIPFVAAELRPTRAEFLRYIRRVVNHFNLNLKQYHHVTAIEKLEGHPEARFALHIQLPQGRSQKVLAKAVAMATGYYESPNLLGVPGEDLPHVSHYYREAHPYFNQRVVIVGGANSAVEAALELYRNGAFPVLVHRGEQLSPKIKPWVRPDIEARLAKNEIPALFNTTVTAIEPDAVHLNTPQGPTRLECDHVLLLTGYRPNHGPLQALGVEIDPVTGVPSHNPETMETNVPGLYLAGVLAAGYDANVIFIENGRFHGQAIVNHLLGRPLRAGWPPRPASR